MKRQLISGLMLRDLSLLAAIVMVATGTANAQILFSENFDGLAGSLGPSVNERIGNSRVTRRPSDFGTSVPIPNAFSHTAPGWTVNSSTYDAYGASVGNVGVALLGDPNYGVDEWEGWSFANKDFWVYVAGDQTRSSFTKASGNVAVADGDEWDDLHLPAPNDQIKGYMNTELKTANIDVSAYRGQTLTLTFDSSWRPEAFDDPHPSLVPPNQNNQGALVAANFDGAAAINDTFLDNWDSNSAGGFYKPDAQNETITKSLVIPATATNVQLKFGYYNASNDWWWALDNLSLKDAASNSVWSENFDAVPLGPSINERNQPGGHVTVVETTANTSPVPAAFTHTAPGGWSVDNSGGVPGISDPNQGVQEWEGWSFAVPSFWLFVKDSNRSQFTKGTGLIAIADPDNWDALGDPESLGTYNSLLVTPSINIAGVAAGTLKLAFDSSWRPEDTQRAILEADYGNGYVEVLRWESDSNSPFFHGDNTNESVLLSLDNPAGATSVKLRWGMVNATDDWWWAVDNIVLSAVPEPCSAMLASLAILVLTLTAGRRRS
jgi:hypothetical protein